jgi:hypothetical protein
VVKPIELVKTTIYPDVRTGDVSRLAIIGEESDSRADIFGNSQSAQGDHCLTACSVFLRVGYSVRPCVDGSG